MCGRRKGRLAGGYRILNEADASKARKHVIPRFMRGGTDQLSKIL
jgi:hypothetical protein